MMSIKRSLDLDDPQVSPQKRLKSDDVDSTPPTPPPSTLASTSSTPRSNNDPRPCIYACTFAPCTATFTRPCRLAEHERRHTGERPFVCNQCSKTFSRDYHLSRHIALSHTDVRDHVCGWQGCDKAFATAQRKREHEKTHERVKTFACEYKGCEEVFRKKSTLAAHVAKDHLGVKPYPCIHLKEGTEEPCKAAYDTQGKLNEHVRKWHSGPRFFCTLCTVDGDISEANDTYEGTTPGTDVEMGDATSPAAPTPVSQQQQLPGFATLQQLLAHKQTYHPAAAKARKSKTDADKSSSVKVRIAKPRARNNQHTVTNLYKSSPLTTMSLPDMAAAAASMRCFRPHCTRTFGNEAELEAHCQLEHGMALVEIADAAYERHALESGVFWLGGIEPGHEQELYDYQDTDGGFDDEYDCNDYGPQRVASSTHWDMDLDINMRLDM